MVSFLLIFSLDHLSDLLVFPRSSQVQLAPSLKLRLSLNPWIEDPFPVLKRNVGAKGSRSLVEGLDFFSSELPV